MDKRVDFKLLEVFLEVYHLQSITRAADALEMTQPGVSGSLKRLQEKLGIKLFVREGRGISPTHHAVQLASDIEPAFRSVYSALGNMQDFDVMTPHTFRVFVNEPTMQLLQPEVASDPLMGNCSIEFHLTPNDEELLLQQLNLQKADLAIDVGFPGSQSYSSEVLYEDELVLICANNHPRIHGTISPEQYFSEKHIVIQMRRTNRYLVDYFITENLQKRLISCECQSLLSMMALVAKSDCIGGVTRSLANEFSDNFDLQVLSIPFSQTAIVHRMIWHSRRDHHLAHKWLRNKIVEWVGIPEHNS